MKRLDKSGISCLLKPNPLFAVTELSFGIALDLRYSMIFIRFRTENNS